MKTLGELIGWTSAKIESSAELTKAKEKIFSTELTKIIIGLLVAYLLYKAMCSGGGYAPRGKF